MLRRMLFVALILGVPSAFADGIAVMPTAGPGISMAGPMMGPQLNVRIARGSGQALYKALLFSKSTKMARPAEQGDITF
jgi:hypothetical protein